MNGHFSEHQSESDSTRRGFLKKIGLGAVAGGMATPLLDNSLAAGASETTDYKVKHRVLGKTGLSVSEIGFGGHSWAYKQVPDGKGGLRRPTVDETAGMIAAGLDMGVNFLDSCTAMEESSTPGQAIKRLRAYPNNSWIADIFRGNGASERIQKRKNGKQRTDTGFRTNYGKRSSL